MSDYFANKTGQELVAALHDKVDQFKSFCRTTGRTVLWQKCYHQYHLGEQREGKLLITGKQGEVMKISVNHFRNLLLHIFNLVIQQQVNYECRATNTDAESTAKTQIGKSILDYYTRTKKVRRYANSAAEYAGYLGEGFVSAVWDPEDGEIYELDEDGSPLMTGDIRYCAHTPNNVIRDVAQSGKDNWYIIREFVNKYDIAAPFKEKDPELYERITGIGVDIDIEDELNQRDIKASEAETDKIAYYRFFHSKTPACPNGKYVEFLDDDIVVVSGDLPYSNVPVWKITANEQAEVPFGYSVSFDLLPMQEAANGLHSSCLSAAKAGGIDTVVADKGAGIEAQDFDQGFTLLYKNPGTDLKTMNMSGVSPLVMDYMKIIDASLETISGVNSESRGRIEREMSGSALALLHQITVTFVSQYEEGYRQLNEDIGQGTLEINQMYAMAPKVAMIGGRAKGWAEKEWTKKDLEGISRVSVEAVNPQSKTYAGRLQLAENLMKIPGAIKTPQDYLMVVETGNVDHMMEPVVSNLANIKMENEMISEGKTPKALITDNHVQHIINHSEPLNSPEKRQDPAVVQSATQHIQEHIMLLQNPDMQTLYSILGYASPPPPMQGGGPGMQNPPPPGGNEPNMPKMPKNPTNGQEYQIN